MKQWLLDQDQSTLSHRTCFGIFEKASRSVMERVKLDETTLCAALDQLDYESFELVDDDVMNLENLLNFYKVWGHKIYPQYPFERFVSRISILCRTRNLGTWYKNK